MDLIEEIEMTEIPIFQEVDGNIIELFYQGKFNIIGQGCNCYKLMGAGLAAQIAAQIPEMRDADKDDPRQYWQRLGDFTQAEIGLDAEGNTGLGLNIYSQLEPGKNFDPIALRLALRKINKIFVGTSIGLPLIGCGIAGGDWEEVKEIIKEELSDMYVTIVHYKVAKI